MEIAKKRINKTVGKINEKNEKNVRKRLNQIVDLKFGKIRKEVQKGNHYHHNILVHEDSFKFSRTTKCLLDLVNEYMSRYPFLRLYIKDNFKDEPNSLGVDINWDDYLNLLNGIDLEPRGDLGKTIRTMNSKNTKIFEAALKSQIKKAKNASQFSKGQTSQKIFLAQGTMHHPATRIHFQKLITSFQKRFPFVEIRYERTNVAHLRVFWDNYYEQPTQGGEQFENGHLVMGSNILLDDSSYDYAAAAASYQTYYSRPVYQHHPPQYQPPPPQYQPPPPQYHPTYQLPAHQPIHNNYQPTHQQTHHQQQTHQQQTHQQQTHQQQTHQHQQTHHQQQTHQHQQTHQQSQPEHYQPKPSAPPDEPLYPVLDPPPSKQKYKKPLKSILKKTRTQSYDRLPDVPTHSLEYDQHQPLIAL